MIDAYGHRIGSELATHDGIAGERLGMKRKTAFKIWRHRG